MPFLFGGPIKSKVVEMTKLTSSNPSPKSLAPHARTHTRLAIREPHPGDAKRDKSIAKSLIQACIHQVKLYTV